ncbi:hypothetical protein B0T19DRAFT_395869 [Cercophora scortea]|uniref:Uncharacterized protein n=1 Tax=Cercophora scortea TaxID=314031 RepID=A0AAE0J352_9PEZI|nr:hypothetical protein B0T19DRAFT_395869 [Cercophora scortea]
MFGQKNMNLAFRPRLPEEVTQQQTAIFPEQDKTRQGDRTTPPPAPLKRKDRSDESSSPSLRIKRQKPPSADPAGAGKTGYFRSSADISKLRALDPRARVSVLRLQYKLCGRQVHSEDEKMPSDPGFQTAQLVLHSLRPADPESLNDNQCEADGTQIAADPNIHLLWGDSTVQLIADEIGAERQRKKSLWEKFEKRKEMEDEMEDEEDDEAREQRLRDRGGLALETRFRNSLQTRFGLLPRSGNKRRRKLQSHFDWKAFWNLMPISLAMDNWIGRERVT